MAEKGRVGMWRGGVRSTMSVAAPFVWRCLSGSAITPFPHPAHRTQQADFPHCALGQVLTPSPTTGRGRAGSDVRARSTRRGARVDSSRACVACLVLEPQPPAQPHSHVCVERAIRLAGGADAEVIGPPAEHAVQLVYELCGLLPGTRADGQRVDGFDHALDALL